MATVSRATALWAVISLGVNTFAQTPGTVLGQEKTFGRAIRTSPLACAFDSVVIIFELVYLLYKGHSLGKTLLKVALARGLRDAKEPQDISKCPTGKCAQSVWTVEPPAAEEWRRTSYELPPKCLCEEAQPRKKRKVEQPGWFRFLLFALTAFPQTVKLLALRGMPWTQAMGLSYVTSYLIIEFLDIFAGEDDMKYLHIPSFSTTEVIQATQGPELMEGQLQPLEGQVLTADLSPHRWLDYAKKRSLLYTVLAGHVVFYIYGGLLIFSSGEHPITATLDTINLVGLYIGAFAGSLWLLYATQLLVQAFASEKDRETSILYKRLSLRMQKSIQDFILRFPRWAFVTQIGVPLLACGAMVALLTIRTTGRIIIVINKLAGPACVQATVFRLFRSHVRQQPKADITTKVLVFDTFAWWNLQSAVLYYAFIYDPVGTFDPGWANSLG